MNGKSEAGKALSEAGREAFRGWRVWRRIVRRMKAAGGYEPEAAVVIAVPEDPDGELLAALHLPGIGKTTGHKVFFCSANPAMEKALPVFLKDGVFILASADDLRALMCLWQLVKIRDRVVFASLFLPFGRIGERMVGVKGITEDEVFALGVCGIWQYERPVLPDYQGRDEDVIWILREAKRVLKEKADGAA